MKLPALQWHSVCAKFHEAWSVNSEVEMAGKLAHHNLMSLQFSLRNEHKQKIYLKDLENGPYSYAEDVKQGNKSKD
jgi:hypothetical protein